jgi:hypothetical protein
MKVMLESISSMYVTYPPCKTLGLYHFDELVDALEACALTVMSTWKREANKLYDIVAESHWIDDLWRVPAQPTIVIFMDNHEMPNENFGYEALARDYRYEEAHREVSARMGYGAHITCVPYLAARPFRASREGEWIPKELFEPMKSETGRSPINYDT